jgi:hypothetical protein
MVLRGLTLSPAAARARLPQKIEEIAMTKDFGWNDSDELDAQAVNKWAIANGLIHTHLPHGGKKVKLSQLKKSLEEQKRKSEEQTRNRLAKESKKNK